MPCITLFPLAAIIALGLLVKTIGALALFTNTAILHVATQSLLVVARAIAPCIAVAVVTVAIARIIALAIVPVVAWPAGVVAAIVIATTWLVAAHYPCWLALCLALLLLAQSGVPGRQGPGIGISIVIGPLATLHLSTLGGLSRFILLTHGALLVVVATCRLLAVGLVTCRLLLLEVLPLPLCALVALLFVTALLLLPHPILAILGLPAFALVASFLRLSSGFRSGLALNLLGRLGLRLAFDLAPFTLATFVA